MKFPAGLKYTKEHEWIKVDGAQATIGITDFAQKELGDSVCIDIDTLGKEVHAGSVFGTIEAVKTVSDLYMPITGTILEMNDTLEAEPESVNGDPYGSGWLVICTVKDPSELEGLMSADEYKAMVGH